MQATIKKQKIGIFGYGNMGRAILKLLKNSEEFKTSAFYICSQELKSVSGATCVNDLAQLCYQSDIIFLCIKPQDFYQLKPLNNVNKNLLIISIMAGVKINNINKVINSNKIIRAMPNLNLQVGESVSGWYADKQYFTARELKNAKKTFNCFGQNINLKNEEMLNAITAVSGSGPAYVFLFINALIKSAKKLGFTEEEARQIVLKTVSGSLSYLERESSQNLEELISKVASKKGTTEAALKELEVNKFYKGWEKAINKAFQRAREISNK